jgi:16S rRNA (cytosine1402-N4)-methyltransferase
MSETPRTTPDVHVPVLLDEVLHYLAPERGGTFVDCTVGLGGHARALLQRGVTRLIGIDRDRRALVMAAVTLANFGDRVELVHADYRQLPRLLDERGLAAVDGILADLGVSSMQLDSEGRGFSFRRDEPLDMRMDDSQGETAADLLARVEEQELADIIYQFGEERHSRRIARALVRARDESPLRTTGQVADIVRRANRRRGYERIDPATRTFQALRIWVNRELDGLDVFVTSAAARLAAGGRLAVVSFHSLEDRIVKHTFRRLDEAGLNVRILTKRPIVAGDDEVARNPRARSAKLRAVERTPEMSRDFTRAVRSNGR